MQRQLLRRREQRCCAFPGVQPGGASRLPGQHPSPAALLAGSEPHRAGVCQAEGATSQSGYPHQRGPLDYDRTSPRQLQPNRVPELPRQLRRRVRVNWRSSRASGRGGAETLEIRISFASGDSEQLTIYSGAVLEAGKLPLSYKADLDTWNRAVMSVGLSR